MAGLYETKRIEAIDVFMERRREAHQQGPPGTGAKAFYPLYRGYVDRYRRSDMD